MQRLNRRVIREIETTIVRLWDRVIVEVESNGWFVQNLRRWWEIN